MLENRGQKKTRGPKGNEITVGCKKRHIEEHHDLHSSQTLLYSQKRRMKWAGHLARIGRKINSCRVLVRKPGRKRSI